MRSLIALTALTTLLPLAVAAQARQPVYIGPPGVGHILSDKKTGTLNQLPQDYAPRLVDETAANPSLADEKRVGRPAPEKDAPVYLEKLSLDNSVLVDARVELLGAPEGSDHRWNLSIIERPLFLQRLLELTEVDSLPPLVADQQTGYRGITVTLINHDGTHYAPIHIFRDQIRMYGTHPRLRDNGRGVEYWLASTAKTVGQFNTVSQLIPPATYEECQMLGFQILYSTPRQCVLADGTTFIEGARPKAANMPAITSFDACAADAENRMIDTFPRKCIAPGGRLLIEPPPALDLPQQAEPEAAPASVLPEALPEMPVETMPPEEEAAPAATPPIVP